MSTSPIPAQSLEPLSYQVPAVSRRPGILTAVGIISIIVGCLSGLSSCGGIASSVMFLTMRNMTIPMPPARTVPGGTRTSAASASPSVTIGGIEHDVGDVENGLDASASNKVVFALGRLHPMTGGRRAHLTLLLKTHGKTMFPTLGAKSTSAEFRDAVTAGGLTGDGANWYTIGTGRIEVNDQRALYRPSDGVEVAEASTTGATSSATGGVTYANQTNTINLTTGRVTSTTAGPTTAPMPVPIMPFKIDPGTAILSISENTLSLGVAILLLVAGILVMRDSPKARRLHWIYVFVKIPLIAIAAVATAMMTVGMMSSFTPSGAGGGGLFPNWIGLMQALMGAAIALTYPLGLIFVLNSRSVRQFYAPPEPPAV